MYSTYYRSELFMIQIIVSLQDQDYAESSSCYLYESLFLGKFANE